jgi:hypothetical protein
MLCERIAGPHENRQAAASFDLIQIELFVGGQLLGFCVSADDEAPDALRLRHLALSSYL